MNNLVSIIMPTYNCDKYIEAAIDSVKEQSYKNWELLLIDDFSQDLTLNILKNIIESDSRIKLFKLESNFGSAYARNKGIELAKGRFLAFLDSDDIWYSEKLSQQISFMLKGRHSFSFTSYNKINENGAEIGANLVENNIVEYSDLLYTNSIGCLTVILDLEVLGKKYFMPLIKKRNDYALWLTLLRNGNKAYGLPKVLASYRFRKSSLSSNKFDVIKYQWEIYRLHQHFSILKSIYYMIFYAYYGFKKTYNN